MYVGYYAISYHFGFSSSLRGVHDEAIQKKSCNDISVIQKSLHEKYEKEMQSIDRLVNRSIVEKRKTQDLIAYYPNPIYLGDVARYLRPDSMRYKDYVKASMKDVFFESRSGYCDKNRYLTKYSDASYKRFDEYSSILERLYPGEKIYFNNNGKIDHVYFKRMSIYAFRGDTRDIDAIYEAGGFWPRVCLKEREDVGGVIEGWKKKFACDPGREGSMISFAKNNITKLLDNDSFWEFNYMYGTGIIPYRSAYISSSNIHAVAREYARDGYVYAFFSEGILSWSGVLDGVHVDKSGLQEMAVPGGIEWKNIAGARKQQEIRAEDGNKYHLVGPVSLSVDLFKSDPDNFWKILQIMGGDLQCSNDEILSRLVSICLELLGSYKKESKKNIDESLVEKLMGFECLDKNLLEKEAPILQKIDDKFASEDMLDEYLLKELIILRCSDKGILARAPKVCQELLGNYEKENEKNIDESLIKEWASIMTGLDEQKVQALPMLQEIISGSVGSRERVAKMCEEVLKRALGVYSLGEYFELRR